MVVAAWRPGPQPCPPKKPLRTAAGCYFLIDCPGQVELFTLHSSLKAVVGALTGGWAYRLTAVSLVDAHLCTDAAK